MTAHPSLDDPTWLAAHDPQDMLGLVAKVPAFVADAAQRVAGVVPKEWRGQIDRVVVIAMGGSAIGSELAATLAQLEGTVPVTVVRDYSLPAYVGERTLVVGSSYSGNTEETISAFSQAKGRTPYRLVIASGGAIVETARADKLPLFSLPTGIPPRTTMTHSFVGLAQILTDLELLPAQTPIDHVAATLERAGAALGPTVPTADNRAKQLALALKDRLAIVIASEHLAPAASRWKGELNENGKSLAYPDLIPELLHNTILGLPHPAAAPRLVRFVLLTSPRYHARNQRRYALFRPILTEAGHTWEDVVIAGQSRFEELLLATQLSSATSTYLGLLNGVDPYDFETIEVFKRALGPMLDEARV
ncbi:hypothetical protein HY375_02635 [Candidatus Berkelbacteria bacterium]|nr:hypothetical protein [Candidatus Berkelbacteria bacterium]